MDTTVWKRGGGWCDVNNDGCEWCALSLDGAHHFLSPQPQLVLLCSYTLVTTTNNAFLEVSQRAAPFGNSITS